MTTPPTDTIPACFGVACPLHQTCQRYHLSEGTPQQTIGTCEQDGARPLFVAVVDSEGGEV